MALRRVPGRDRSYHLISFDRRGVEQPDPDGTHSGEAAIEALTASPDDVTDVFILSHGWQGDYDGAIGQYDRWLAAADVDRPDDGIRPFVIGLQWPSKPWSDTPLRARPTGLLGDDESGHAVTVPESVDEFAANIAGTEVARAALETILGAAASIDPDADATPSAVLPVEVTEAYRTLAGEMEVGSAEDSLLGAAWDPAVAFAEAAEHGGDGDDGLLGDGFWGKLRDAMLAPLRQLSFWTMKDRARAFGERGGSTLLRSVQEVAPRARVHLMGHSFGTIVVSASVRGSGTTPQPPLRPVESMFLAQGAVSLWAFAAEVPESVGGGRGTFADLARPEFVAGPIIATRSKWDYAVGRYYPLAVRVANQFLLDETPKYGGIGAYGIQGVDAKDLPALATGVLPEAPEFGADRFYNLEASRVIANVAGVAGAHNDIAHRELAWLAWEAARSRVPAGG